MKSDFQRNTRQRQVILEELQRLVSHPTAAELHSVVRQRLPKVSLGTVYRNLDAMVQRGLVRKLEFSGKEVRFDGDLNDHDHIRCIRCGRVDDLEAKTPYTYTEKVEDLRGYKVLGYRLEFIGICPKCKDEKVIDDEGVSNV
jgi:Fur family ferric uptake transcriptional regulator